MHDGFKKRERIKFLIFFFASERYLKQFFDPILPLDLR